MDRGQFPNRIKSNQPSGRRLLRLNGTNPLLQTFLRDRIYVGTWRGILCLGLLLV